jgi:carbon monoxide dehydrogenase subunit G
MEFSDAFEIPAPREQVWAAMFDPEVMREVLPGCRRLERRGPEAFDVTLAAGIGVLRGVFTGSVAFSDLAEPEACAMTIAAAGSLGRVQGDGTITLEPSPAGTVLRYRAAFVFGGPMSGLGEGLVRGVADALTREAMSRFSRIVQAAPTPR